MTTPQPPFTFTRARAGRNSLAVTAVIDDMDAYYPFCRFCWYNHSQALGQRWGDDHLDVRAHGLTLFQRPERTGRQFVVLSSEGDVIFIEDPKNYVENIPGAGISSPDSKYWGRMENIRAIGDRLYACGDGGQVYRREHDGIWQNLDPSLLQGSEVPAEKYDIFQRINGSREDAIYVVGDFGKILFWDGTAFKRVPSESDHMLIDILIESEDVVWICGAKGTSLRGNHRDGFRQVPGIEGYWAHLTTMAMYAGKLYLSSASEGLFTYENARLKRVFTGLTPEIEDIHTVDISNNILWTVGLKDITRFDGQHWERIDFPGNDPVL
jgi:hypothetical protein